MTYVDLFLLYPNLYRTHKFFIPNHNSSRVNSEFLHCIHQCCWFNLFFTGSGSADQVFKIQIRILVTQKDQIRILFIYSFRFGLENYGSGSGTLVSTTLSSLSLYKCSGYKTPKVKTPKVKTPKVKTPKVKKRSMSKSVKAPKCQNIHCQNVKRFKTSKVSKHANSKCTQIKKNTHILTEKIRKFNVLPSKNMVKKALFIA